MVNVVAPGRIVSLSPPLFVRTRPVPVRPERVPPTGYACVEHETVTSIALPATTAEPLPMVHVCVGVVGDAPMATVYVVPLATFVLNVYVLFAGMGSVSAPFNVNVRPLPTTPMETTCTVYWSGTHVTWMLVTGPPPTLPAPPVKVQVSHGVVGWVFTVTTYGDPLATAIGNSNVPLAITGSVSPPLSCSTSPLPVRPDTVPPTAYAAVTHETLTDVTLAVPMMPVPPVSEHVWLGPVGCV